MGPPASTKRLGGLRPHHQAPASYGWPVSGVKRETVLRYAKIYRKIINDRAFQQLTDEGKLAWFILFVHTENNMLGAFRYSHHALAGDLDWAAELAFNAMSELEAAKFIDYDQQARCVRWRNYLKHNAPENPNQLVGMAKTLELVPECQLKDDLIEDVRQFVEAAPEKWKAKAPEVFKRSGEVRQASLGLGGETKLDEERSQLEHDKKTFRVTEFKLDDARQELLDHVAKVYPVFYQRFGEQAAWEYVNFRFDTSIFPYWKNSKKQDAWTTQRGWVDKVRDWLSRDAMNKNLKKPEWWWEDQLKAGVPEVVETPPPFEEPSKPDSRTVKGGAAALSKLGRKP